MPLDDLKLRPSQRVILKKPMGVLIPGSGEIAWSGVKKLISELKPKLIVAVGDETSKLFANRELSADVYIVDGSVMREKAVGIKISTQKRFELRNPAGFISSKAWEIISQSFSIRGGVLIDVDGEEDLLALVAVLEAPLGSIVFYGQPGEGLVAIPVTEAKKEEFCRIVEGMERKSFSNR
ncbi:MAG: GTP-dependent dephospho-CoA kinase family protein [Thermoproteota archaeon]